MRTTWATRICHGWVISELHFRFSHPHPTPPHPIHANHWTFMNLNLVSYIRVALDQKGVWEKTHHPRFKIFGRGRWFPTNYRTQFPVCSKLSVVNQGFFMCHIYWSETEQLFLFYILWQLLLYLQRLLVDNWSILFGVHFQMSCFIKTQTFLNLPCSIKVSTHIHDALDPKVGNGWKTTPMENKDRDFL